MQFFRAFTSYHMLSWCVLPLFGCNHLETNVDFIQMSVLIYLSTKIAIFLAFCRVWWSFWVCFVWFTKLIFRVSIIDLKMITIVVMLTIDLITKLNDGRKLSLLMSGDVHPNPGPMTRPLKFCHWNLNSILSRDSVKVSLIQAYNLVFNFDLIALSETYLNTSIGNDAFNHEGFSRDIFRSDHPSNAKRGGVCLYYKENMCIRQRNDLQTLSESIVTEITIGKKKIFFVVLPARIQMNSTTF